MDESIGELSLARLEVWAPTLFDGYLGRPNAHWGCIHRRRLVTVTGDVVAIDPGGMRRIVGRESTELIKTGGYRVGAG